MIIPIINDLHFGVKNGSSVVRNYSKKFLDDFFVYLDNNKCREILFLGDFFDNRRIINIETLNFVRKNFLEPLRSRGIVMHMILGNHDCYYKNTNDLNSIKELLHNYDNIKIYEKHTEIVVGDTKFAACSWLTEENFDDFKILLQNTTSKYLLGHFEIQGFQVIRGVNSEKGLPKSALRQFEYVFSGHYHVKQDDGQIYYLGTQYDMTFADIDEKKGFHVFDTVANKLTFIENPHKLFFKYVYDDTADVPDVDVSKYANGYVKFIIKNKKKPKLLDSILDKFYHANVAHLSVIDETELYIDSSNEEVDQTQDTMSIICRDIDTMKDIEKPDKLKQIMHTLFVESFEVE